MVLITEKRRTLVEAASKLKVGVCLSDAKVVAPANAPLMPIPAPNPSIPAPADLRQKGVVEAAAFEDEDIYYGLVFKRKRGVDAAVSAQSALDGRASSFRENPPSASSPRDLVVHEDGGESSLRGDFVVPPAAELPTFLQKVIQSFQDGEMESQGEKPLRGHAARGLGATSSHPAAP